MVFTSRLKTMLYVTALCMPAFLTEPVFAQGTRAVDVAKITISARQSGMGGAFAGIADDINTLGINPAGLSLLQRMSLSGSYNDWIGGSSYGFAALAIPRKVGTFGVGVNYFNMTEVEGSDQAGTPTGEMYSAYTFRAMLGYGAILHERVQFGTALSLTHTKLGSTTQGFGGLDFGFLFPVMKERLTLGIAARNVAVSALKTTPDTGDDLPPTSVTLGAGLFVHDFESVKINAGLDGYIPVGDGDTKINFGTEFIIKDVVALRAGYRGGYDEEKVTLGAGIHYKDFWVDYSYHDMDLLDEAHRFTVTMDFGAMQHAETRFGDGKSDKDADGIEDYLDRCPTDPEDKDGYEDYDGCPEPDNDHDGIKDTDDKCPLLPETFNNHEDTDGCPDIGDSGMSEAKIKELLKDIYDKNQGGTISGSYLLQEKYTYIVPIYFDTASDKLRPEAYNLIEQVASLILDSKDVEGVIAVEGYTDNRKDHDYNQELAERRAFAVKDALVKKYSVPADILIPIGIGESRNVAPNDTEENRQLNRRVEFRVFQKKAIEGK